MVKFTLWLYQAGTLFKADHKDGKCEVDLDPNLPINDPAHIKQWNYAMGKRSYRPSHVCLRYGPGSQYASLISLRLALNQLNVK
jgi:hypothetical protein